MVYLIRKLPKQNLYRVYNKQTKKIYAYSTTLENAKKQVTLLNMIDAGVPLKKQGKGIDNPEIYEKAKKIADEKYKKPSAYKSGFIIKKYKELGGTYSGKKPETTGIARWLKEEWADIGNKEYPVYRPTKRITKETPLTVEEIKPSNLKKQIALKQKIKGSNNLPPFEEKTENKISINNIMPKVWVQTRKRLSNENYGYLSRLKFIKATSIYNDYNNKQINKDLFEKQIRLIANQILVIMNYLKMEKANIEKDIIKLKKEIDNRKKLQPIKGEPSVLLNKFKLVNVYLKELTDRKEQLDSQLITVNTHYLNTLYYIDEDEDEDEEDYSENETKEEDEENLIESKEDDFDDKENEGGGFKNKKISTNNKKMPNAWIQHVKAYASKHKMTYRDALKDPKCKESYKGSSVKKSAYMPNQGIIVNVYK